MKSNQYFKLFSILLTVLLLTACADSSKTLSQISSQQQLSTVSDSHEDFQDQQGLVTLTTDFDQVHLKNQTVLYSAWGRFTKEGYEEPNLLQQQCCYVTADFSADQDSFETDLNMIISFNGEFIFKKIDTILQADADRITVGSLHSADLNGDGLDELVLNFSVGNGNTVTRIYKVTQDTIDVIFDFDEFNSYESNLIQKLGYSVSFIKNKKAVLSNSTVAQFKKEIDLSDQFLEEAFDRFGVLKEEDDLRDLYLQTIYECKIFPGETNEVFRFNSTLILGTGYFATVQTTVALTAENELKVLDALVLKT